MNYVEIIGKSLLDGRDAQIYIDEPALYNTGLTTLNCDAYLLQIVQ